MTALLILVKQLIDLSQLIIYEGFPSCVLFPCRENGPVNFSTFHCLGLAIHVQRVGNSFGIVNNYEIQMAKYLTASSHGMQIG